MDILRQAIFLCSTVWALTALSGCAVRPLILNHVADTLAMPAQDAEDEVIRGFQYAQTSAVLLIIILFVTSIDLISSVIRKKFI